MPNYWFILKQAVFVKIRVIRGHQVEQGLTAEGTEVRRGHGNPERSRRVECWNVGLVRKVRKMGI